MRLPLKKCRLETPSCDMVHRPSEEALAANAARPPSPVVSDSALEVKCWEPWVKLGITFSHGGETTGHLHADARPHRRGRADPRGGTPPLPLVADRERRPRPVPQRLHPRVHPLQ